MMTCNEIEAEVICDDMDMTSEVIFDEPEVSSEVDEPTPIYKFGTDVYEGGVKQDKWNADKKADKTALEAETRARVEGDTNTLASANKQTQGLINGLEQAFNTTLDKYGVSLDIVEDASVFKFDFQLKNAKGEVLSSKAIDLPLESVVVNGRYEVASQSIILTLQNGNEVSIPVGDIISGLISKDTFDTAIKELQNELTDIDGIVAENNAEITKLKTDKANKTDIPTSLDAYTQFSGKSLNPEASFVYKDVDTKYKRGNFLNFLDSFNIVTNKNIKNEHNDSTDMVYSAKQVNSEIIDAFKYNFEQIADYGQYLSRSLYGLTIKNNNDGSITLNGLINNRGGVDFYRSFSYIDGHKYYFSSNNQNVLLNTYENYVVGNSFIIDKPIQNNIAIAVKEGQQYSNDIIRPIIIDLTDMFGAGNEPSTVEELYQYIVPNKYYPYGKNIEPRMYAVKADVNNLVTKGNEIWGMVPDYENRIMNIVDKPYINNTFENTFGTGYFVLYVFPKTKGIEYRISLINSNPHKIVGGYRMGAQSYNAFLLPSSLGDKFLVDGLSGTTEADYYGIYVDFIYTKKVVL